MKLFELGRAKAFAEIRESEVKEDESNLEEKDATMKELKRKTEPQEDLLPVQPRAPSGYFGRTQPPVVDAKPKEGPLKLDRSPPPAVAGAPKPCGYSGSMQDLSKPKKVKPSILLGKLSWAKPPEIVRGLRSGYIGPTQSPAKEREEETSNVRIASLGSYDPGVVRVKGVSGFTGKTQESPSNAEEEKTTELILANTSWAQNVQFVRMGSSGGRRRRAKNESKKEEGSTSDVAPDRSWGMGVEFVRLRPNGASVFTGRTQHDVEAEEEERERQKEEARRRAEEEEEQKGVGFLGFGLGF